MSADQPNNTRKAFPLSQRSISNYCVHGMDTEMENQICANYTSQLIYNQGTGGIRAEGADQCLSYLSLFSFFLKKKNTLIHLNSQLCKWLAPVL